MEPKITSDNQAIEILAKNAESETDIVPSMVDINEYIVQTSSSKKEQDERAEHITKKLEERGLLGKMFVAFDTENIDHSGGKTITLDELRALKGRRIGGADLPALDKAIVRQMEERYSEVTQYRIYTSKPGTGKVDIGIGPESLKKFENAEVQFKLAQSKAEKELTQHMPIILKRWGNDETFGELVNDKGLVDRSSIESYAAAQKAPLGRLEVQQQQLKKMGKPPAGDIDTEVAVTKQLVAALEAMAKNTDGIKANASKSDITLADLIRVSQKKELESHPPESKVMSEASAKIEVAIPGAIKTSQQGVDALKNSLNSGGTDLNEVIASINEHLVKRTDLTPAERTKEAANILNAIKDSERDGDLYKIYGQNNLVALENSRHLLNYDALGSALKKVGGADSRLSPMDGAILNSMRTEFGTLSEKAGVRTIITPRSLDSYAAKQNKDRIPHETAAAELKPFLKELKQQWGAEGDFAALSGEKSSVLSKQRLTEAIKEQQTVVNELKVRTGNRAAAGLPTDYTNDLKAYNDQLLKGLKVLEKNFDTFKKMDLDPRGLSAEDFKKIENLLQQLYATPAQTEASKNTPVAKVADAPPKAESRKSEGFPTTEADNDNVPPAIDKAPAVVEQAPAPTIGIELAKVLQINERAEVVEPPTEIEQAANERDLRYESYGEVRAMPPLSRPAESTPKRAITVEDFDAMQKKIDDLQRQLAEFDQKAQKRQVEEFAVKSPPPAIKPQQCDRESYVGQDGRTYNKTGPNGEIYFNLGPNNEQLWIKKDYKPLKIKSGSGRRR